MACVDCEGLEARAISKSGSETGRVVRQSLAVAIVRQEPVIMHDNKRMEEIAQALCQKQGYHYVGQAGIGGEAFVALARDNLNGFHTLKISRKGIHCTDIGELVSVNPLLAEATLLRKARVAAPERFKLFPQVYEGDFFPFNPYFFPYIDMEFIDGVPLHRSKPTFAEAISYGLQIAVCLGVLHDNLHVAHEDLRPENIIISNGRPYMIDISSSRNLVSYGYCAPEKIMDNRHDKKAADIFALGVILYELVTGKRLFNGHISNEDPADRNNEEPPDRNQRALARLDAYLKHTVPRINARDYPPLYELDPTHFEFELSYLADSCLEPEPSQRPSVRQVCNELRQIMRKRVLFAFYNRYS